MKYRFQKGLRIMSDLVSYCHLHGSTDYHVDMKLRKTMSVFMITAPIPHFSTEEMRHLEETLNTPRQHEVEQNYWGLTGEAETDPELTLVGMMIDEAMVDYNDGVLTIVAKRKEGNQLDND